MVSFEHDFTEIHDRDLERRIAIYLVSRQVAALREIDVRADRGTVTLRGEVRSFYHKQLCLNCCRRVAGVVQLVDEVDVVNESPAENSVFLEESYSSRSA
jgi:osmotically-inducible protein OsmY